MGALKCFLFCFFVPRWEEELGPCQVVVMAPATFCSLLTDGVLKMSLVNLLVLDECQSINIPGHPYGQIMKHYKVSLELLYCTD